MYIFLSEFPSQYRHKWTTRIHSMVWLRNFTVLAGISTDVLIDDRLNLPK